jgi:hypothetical protein
MALDTKTGTCDLQSIKIVITIESIFLNLNQRACQYVCLRFVCFGLFTQCLLLTLRKKKKKSFDLKQQKKGFFFFFFFFFHLFLFFISLLSLLRRRRRTHLCRHFSSNDARSLTQSTMIGLIVIAIVALSRRAHDGLEGRRRTARRRSQRAADLMHDALGANWGPHMYPLEWFATHSVCATCDRVFCTVDPDDQCRVADSGCHTFSRPLHDLLRYAVERKYRAAPPPVRLPSAAVADRSNAATLLVVHPPPLESAWVLLDRDQEPVAAEVSPPVQMPLDPQPELPSDPVGSLIGVKDETPGAPFEVPDDAILPPPSPDDDDDDEASSEESAIASDNFPHPPDHEPELDLLPPVPQLEPQQVRSKESIPAQYLM